MTAYFITMIVLHLGRVFLAMGGEPKTTGTVKPATVRLGNIVIYSALAAWGFNLLIEHLQAVAP